MATPVPKIDFGLGPGRVINPPLPSPEHPKMTCQRRRKRVEHTPPAGARGGIDLALETRKMRILRRLLLANLLDLYLAAA